MGANDTYRVRKKNIRILQRLTAGLAAAVFCLALLLPYPASAAKTRVVRVGYPIQQGLTMVNENGQYSGYTYDYLQEIAQYTGWKYEFVRAEGDVNQQLTTLLDMLSRGEIDLLGGIVYNESLTKVFDYPGYNYGTAYNALCVMEDNTKISSSNYAAMDKLRVAVFSASGKKNETLEQFGQMNGVKIEQMIYRSDDEQYAALKAGKADALLCKDVGMPSQSLRIIARFSPQPYYFAIKKGDKELVTGLDNAISSIRSVNSSYESELYDKYFESKSDALLLTEEEKTYIQQVGTLKVLMQGNRAPLQYNNLRSGEIAGITRNVLDYITEHTGLKFSMTMVNTFDEYRYQLASGNYDLVAGAAYDYDNSSRDGYVLTTPYLHVPLVLAMRSGEDASQLKGKRLALSRDVAYSGNFLGEVIRYDSTKDCLEAVHKGEADYTYGMSYIIDYYQNSHSYRNITSIPQPENLSQKRCIGVLQSGNISLISIINKTVGSISENDLQEYLYQNAFQAEDISLWTYLRNNPLVAVTILIAIVLFGLVLSMFLYIFNHRRTNRQMALQNERYEQLSDLSNEFLYEYDIQKDQMHLSEKSASFFECDRVIDHFLEQFKSNLDDSDREHLESLGILTQSKTHGKDFLCRLPNGSKRWLRLVSKIIYDANEKPIFSVGKVVDIQSQKEEQERLIRQAQKDSLTGIYNAAASRREVMRQLAASPDGGALFIIDIDHFKTVNDRFGHFTGDQVLVAIAQSMQEVFRQEDVTGRLGGDEFLVFMAEVKDRELIAQKCEQLTQKLQSMLEGKIDEPVTLSIGVSIAQPGQVYETLYRVADEALYTVKNRGRNGYQIADDMDGGRE